MTARDNTQHPTRRRLLGALLAGLLLASTVHAATQGAPATEADPAEVFDLWPTAPPGGVPNDLAEEVVERPNDLGLRDRIVRHVTRPRITVFRPSGPPRGALLLLPGGGYRHVVVDKEGFETARWLAARGLVVFVLFYRLPADGWAGGADAPLEDAQRAMRVIRARAATWGLDPTRLGVVGFSAGGHLAAQVACRHATPTYSAIDAADGGSARPDAAALMYPVIAMDDPIAHAGSREQLLGPAPSAERIRSWSAHHMVSDSVPPTFILHAADDAAVPLENSLRMAAALRAAAVPVDLHVFATGGHGFGLRHVGDQPVAAWPELLLRWLEQRYRHGAAP